MAEKKGFTAEEKAAMRARAKELKAEGGRRQRRARSDRRDVAAGSRPREAGRRARQGRRSRAHTEDVVRDARLCNKDGKVVVFFKNAGKFKSRYSNLGFSDNANLDAGSMWPTEFALTKLSPADEKKITKLVKQAVS